MAKQNFDDDVTALGDWQPKAKRPNSESTSTMVQNLETPASNRQSLVQVNPMLVGLLEKKPVDKTEFFDNVLHYFNSSGGLSNQNTVSAEPKADNVSFVPIDVDDDGSPKMILNPKAIKRQNSLHNPPDIVPISDQIRLNNEKEIAVKKRKRNRQKVHPEKINLECCIIDKLVKRFWRARCCPPWTETEIVGFLQAGRPMPEIPVLGVFVNLYDHHTWITGCPGMEKLFCWPCLLFTHQVAKTQNTVWVKEGFCSMKILGTSMTKHEMSAGHKGAVMTMSGLWVHCSQITLVTQRHSASNMAITNKADNNTTNSSSKIIQDGNDESMKYRPEATHKILNSLDGHRNFTQNPPHGSLNDEFHHQPGTSGSLLTSINKNLFSLSAEQNSANLIETSITRQDYVKLMEELETKDSTPKPCVNKTPVEAPSSPKPAKLKEVEVRLIQLHFCEGGIWRGNDEVREKIMATGRPKPEMPGLRQEVDGVMMKFSSSYYDIYPWMCGSAELNRLYCWPCLLFNVWNYSSIWNTDGFSSMAELKSAAKAHSTTLAHFKNSLSMKTFERVTYGKTVFDTTQIDKHNAIVRQKKSIMKHLIDAVYFKKKHQCNPGTQDQDYKDFFQILSTYDIELKTQLDTTSASYLNDFTPNFIAEYSRETAKALKIFLRRKIAKEVDDSTYVSFILKTLQHNRVALILRYTKFTGEAIERFFKFIKITFGQPDALLRKILAQVDSLGCSNKFVGISYDGGLFHPADIDPFNSKLRQALPAGYFFHHKDDNLKVLLQQSLSHNPYCRSFIHILGEFGSFLRGNPRVFSLMRRMTHAQQDAWDLKSGIIITVRNNYLQIMKLLDQIANRVLAPTAWSNHVVSQCAKFSMFLGLMESRLLLVVLSKVFLVLHPLIEALQGEFDAKYWKNAAQEVISSILNIQTRDFSTTFAAAIELANGASKPDCDLQEAKSRYFAVFIQTFDWILEFIRARTKYIDVWNFFDVSTTKIDSPVTRAAFSHAKFQLELKECFPFFDNVELGSALMLIHSDARFQKKSIREMLQIMIEWDFKSAMPEFYKFLLLLTTLPTSSGHVSSPVSDKIASYVTGKTELKCADAICCIEKNLLAAARNEYNFYDDVIKIVAELKGTKEFTEIYPSFA